MEENNNQNNNIEHSAKESAEAFINQMEKDNTHKNRNSTKSYVIGIVILITVLIIAVIFYTIGQTQRINDEKNKIKEIDSNITDVNFSNDTTELKLNDFDDYEKFEGSISKINEAIRGTKKSDLIDVEKVRFVVNNNTFKCNEWNTIFKIDDKYGYSKFDFLLDTLNVSEYEYDDFIKKLDDSQITSILELKGSEDANKELDYQVALAIKDKNSDVSLKILNKISSYKDSEQQIQEITELHKCDGKWRGTISYKNSSGFDSSIVHTWIINGNRIYNLYTDSTVTDGTTEYEARRDGSKIELYEKNPYSGEFVFHTFTFEIVDNNTIKYDFNYLSYPTFSMTITKENDSTELPKSEKVKEPQIGMTKSEVEKSTWGSPMKKNKTTTKYGVHEQWVYSGNRYIYFDDNVVTGIQDF